jgi:putative ABC transport system permease protein
MKTSSYLTAPQLLAKRFRTSPVSSILVAVLVLVTAFVAAAAPRLVERQATAELSYQLSTIGPVARAITASGGFLETWYPGTPPDLSQIYGQIDSSFADTRSKFPEPLRSAVGPAQWIAQTNTIQTTLLNGAPHDLGLRLTGDPNYLSRIRVVAGTAPAVWSGNDASVASSSTVVPIQVLLSTTAARSLHVGVGDLLGSGEVRGIPQSTYRVSGLYEPRSPSAQFWGQNPSLIPAFLEKPNIGPSYLAGSAFVAPLTVGRLSGAFDDARVALYYPVTADAAQGADAERLRAQVAEVIVAGIRMPGDGSSPLAVSTGAEQAIATAIQRDAVLSGFLALLASAPLGVTLAVLGLGVEAVVRARRRDIRLAVARGARTSQVRLAMAAEGLVVSVPVAAVATALAAILIPVPQDASGFVLPALVALSPAVLFAALATPRETTASQARARRRTRAIAEVAVLLLAALALALLSRRGLAQANAAVGIDPLLVATPLLLSVSVGILVLRGYPFLLRAARLRTARSRGLAGFVGSIRATRSPTVGLVGVLALVVGISIAIFSTVMLSTFDGATDAAAKETVGADVRVDAASFSVSQRVAVAKVPGVLDVAGIQHLDTRTLRGTGVIDTVGLMVGQTNALRSLRPRLAANLGTASKGRVPVVVSSDLAAEVTGHSDLTLDGVPIMVAGVLPRDSELGPVRSWILVDSAFSERFSATFSPDLLLLSAHPTAPGLRDGVARAVGGAASVETVASVSDARRSEPAVAGVRFGLVLGALISVLLCAIALVLSTIVAGRARSRTAGILRTLGLPSRSLRVLVAWELVPVVVVATVAGTALGLALPFLLTAAVDLRPFAGGTVRPVPLFDATFVALVLAAFCVVVAVVGILAVAAGERLNPSTAIKMGAQ